MPTDSFCLAFVLYSNPPKRTLSLGTILKSSTAGNNEPEIEMSPDLKKDMYTTWGEMIRHWPKTTLCIVSNEFCERFSYYGMRRMNTVEKTKSERRRIYCGGKSEKAKLFKKKEQIRSFNPIDEGNNKIVRIFSGPHSVSVERSQIQR
uniref:Uncharacterized protein n=1 Tax=Angiostrongylus cantonensis TaxID=6313 RepID=A0A0K0D701_ANGCA